MSELERLLATGLSKTRAYARLRAAKIAAGVKVRRNCRSEGCTTCDRCRENAHCPRCDLRGEHVCKREVWDVAADRPGAG